MTGDALCKLAGQQAAAAVRMQLPAVCQLSTNNNTQAPGDALYCNGDNLLDKTYFCPLGWISACCRGSGVGRMLWVCCVLWLLQDMA